jgi:phospholipase C
MTKKYVESVRRLLSRRRALQGVGALAGTALIGCGDDSSTGDASTGDETGTESSTSSGTESSSESSTGDGDGDGDATTGDGDGDGDATTGDGDGSMSCTDDGGLDAAALLANIDHIVVLCMENRSWDHYFGSRKLLESEASNGLSGDETNPNMANDQIPIFPLPDDAAPADPPHQWDEVHATWNSGAIDQFVIENEKINPGAAAEVMGYHVRSALPMLYSLADSYCLLDNYFCSLLAGTWPNRYYLHAATSGGQQSNFPATGIDSIQDICDDAGISHNNYYDGLVSWQTGAFPITSFTRTDSIDEFFTNVENGTLEEVVIIDPDFLSNDDHPSNANGPALGQVLISTIYQALAESDQWDRTLLLITYDEHGGFFDHVVPPAAVDDEPGFGQLGFRVPAVVVGGQVRRGCVISELLEHASWPATVTRKHGLAELNSRAAASRDLSVCVDPQLIDNPAPATPLPKIEVSISEALAHVGQQTSQHELFELAGIEVPLRGRHMRDARAQCRRLLERAEKLGTVRLRP